MNKCVFNTIFASNTLFMALKFIYIYIYIYISVNISNFNYYLIYIMK